MAHGAGQEHLYYWPELVARDERFDRFSIYLGGFYTEVDAGSFGLEDCAQQLFDAIRQPTKPGELPLIKRRTLVFVCTVPGGSLYDIC